MSDAYDVPVLFTIYNRPRHAELVFERIRQVRPRQLFVAADGPSPQRAGDAERCGQARAIVERVDWKCDLRKLYSETNRGCRRAMAENIGWFFQNVSEGVILEDDCLPHPSFFRFCREMLEFYRHDTRVMLVCGDNKRVRVPKSGESYYFSRLVHIWGWATWKRAWAHYDADLKSFPLFKTQGRIGHLFSDPDIQRFWLENFELVHRRKLDTWDYQWVYTVFTQGGLSIMPSVNLVGNIGFGPEATHTTSIEQVDSFLQADEIGPIRHPEFVIPNNSADEEVINDTYGAKRSAWKTSVTEIWRRLRYLSPSVRRLRKRLSV